MEDQMQAQLLQDMFKLFRNSIMSDVTLVVGEQCEDNNNKVVEFPVHKAILASRCQYFYTMFHSMMQETSSGVVVIPEKHPDDFKVLLDYIYTAKLNINPENAFGVLRLSDEYGIELVKDQCISYVKDFVNDDNVFDVLDESVYHNFQELALYCKQYLELNAKKLFFHESFLRISKASLIDILKSNKLMVSEIEIFIAVIQWGKYQVEKKKNVGTGKGKSVRKSRTLLNRKRVKPPKVTPSKPVVFESTTDEPISRLPRHSNVSDATGSQLPLAHQVSLSASEQVSLGVSPIKKKSKSKKFGSSLPTDLQLLGTSALSLSEIDSVEDILTESEVTDSGFDEEEEDEDNNSDFINLRPGSPRQLSNLLNLTITSSASILEPANHVNSAPTAFQQQDSTHLQKRFANLFDYTSDKNYVNSLSALVADLMEYIRFPTLDPHEVYDFVEPSQVVPKNYLLEAYRSHALSTRLDIHKSPRMRVRDGSLFWYPGVLGDVPIKLLKGWTCVYQQPYSHPTSEAVLLEVKGTRVLIAARHKNSSRLALCAMGRREAIMKETFENETTFDNGVYFYHWKNRSIGFSPENDINLGTADLSSGSKKLSWHLTGRGGYRCGNLTRLNDSSEWEKLIFIAR